MLLVPGKRTDKIVLVSNQYIQDPNDKNWIKILPRVILKHRVFLDKERTTNQTLCLSYLDDELQEPPLVPFQACCLSTPDNTPHLFAPTSIEMIEKTTELLDPSNTDPFQDGSLHSFFTFDKTLSDVVGNYDLHMVNPRWKTGKFSNCLDLYRQTWINSPITVTRLPQFKQGFTISFWIYPYGSYNSRQQGIVQFTESTYEDDESGMGNTRRPYIWLDRDGRKLGVSVDLENGVTENFVTSCKLDRQKWTHVVLVVYPNSIELFVNSDMVFNRIFDERIALSSCYLCVGTVCTRHVKNFRIDQLLIFNRPLSSHEVIYLFKQGTTVSKNYAYYDISNLKSQEPPVKCDLIDGRVALDGRVSVDHTTLIIEQDFSKEQLVRFGDILCLQIGHNFHKLEISRQRENLRKEILDPGILRLLIETDIQLDDLVHVYITRPIITLGIGQPYLEDTSYCVYDMPLEVVSSTFTSVTINKQNLTDTQRRVLLNQKVMDLDVAVDVEIEDIEETPHHIIITTDRLPLPPTNAWLRCRYCTSPTINHVEYLRDLDMLNIVYNDLVVGNVTTVEKACGDFQFRFEVSPMGHLVLKGFYYDLMRPE